MKAQWLLVLAWALSVWAMVEGEAYIYEFVVPKTGLVPWVQSLPVWGQWTMLIVVVLLMGLPAVLIPGKIWLWMAHEYGIIEKGEK